jgi:ectoine hydroxylase-related dioxygenase (phytanoyl-CoA dioxygenase family)
MQTSPSSPSPLNQQQLHRFAEQGFLVLRKVFGPDEIDEMRRAFERLAERARSLEVDGTEMWEGSQFVVSPRDDGEPQIHRIVWCGGAESTLLDYGTDPRLVEPAAQLLDTRAVEQLINQAHFKYPGDEITFEWHQDSKHRRYGTDQWRDLDGRGSFIETATAIDPMTPDNGPLRFIPGSHEQGHVPVDDEGCLPDDAYDPDEAVDATMEPGDVVLFGPFVVHGSGPNQSNHPRRLFLNGFATPGANSRDYPGAQAGRRLEVDETSMPENE